jgi:hypothetical protein
VLKKMDKACMRIHCVNNTLKIAVGEVSFVKEILEFFRKAIGFSGGYLYANDVLLHDYEKITISALFFYEIRDGVLDRGKIIYFYFLYISYVKM